MNKLTLALIVALGVANVQAATPVVKQGAVAKVLQMAKTNKAMTVLLATTGTLVLGYGMQAGLDKLGYDWSKNAAAKMNSYVYNPLFTTKYSFKTPRFGYFDKATNTLAYSMAKAQKDAAISDNKEIQASKEALDSAKEEFAAIPKRVSRANPDLVIDDAAIEAAQAKQAAAQEAYDKAVKAEAAKLFSAWKPAEGQQVERKMIAKGGKTSTDVVADAQAESTLKVKGLLRAYPKTLVAGAVALVLAANTIDHGKDSVLGKIATLVAGKKKAVAPAAA